MSDKTATVAADSDGSSGPDNACQAEADGENGEDGVEDGVEEIDCSPVRRIGIVWITDQDVNWASTPVIWIVSRLSA